MARYPRTTTEFHLIDFVATVAVFAWAYAALVFVSAFT